MSTEIPLGTTELTLFARLRHHAYAAPLSVAVSSRYRPVTYRKLWSRIERATARLQAEWGIAAGDVLAYAGRAHPDALVLYLALLRSGAYLLPLPPQQTPTSAARLASWRELISAGKVKRLVLEDELASEWPDDTVLGLPCSRLSALITVRCPHQPLQVVEEATLPGLMDIGRNQTGDLVLQHVGKISPAPWSGPPETDARMLPLVGEPFAPQVLSTIVLPRLLAGSTLLFKQETDCDSGAAKAALQIGMG